MSPRTFSSSCSDRLSMRSPLTRIDARIGLEQPENQFQDDRFSRAARSEQKQRASRPDRKAHVARTTLSSKASDTCSKAIAGTSVRRALGHRHGPILRRKRAQLSMSPRVTDMAIHHTRRDVLRGTLAAAGLGMLGIPEWALPALAQGETLVPFTDAPPTFPAPGPVNRQYDIRTIDGPFTPADRFFTTQHYGHPVVDPATFRLKVTGLVNRPLSLVARRAAQDRQHRAHRRLRMLGQPAPTAGAVRERPMDRRAAARRARPRRASSRRCASSSSSAPIAALKKSSSARRNSPSNSSTAGA